MRIHIWGINYLPEATGIAPFNAGLCEDLRRRGHDVRMVSTFAYYPQWKKSPADRGRLYRTDSINDVRVHRCWHYVPARVTTLRRIFHELSFGVTSFLRMLALPRADVVVVVSPPLVLGVFAFVLTRLKRTRYGFHVQDLQPDAAVGLGMMKPGLITRVLYRMEAFAYRHAAFVSGISHGMIEAYVRKGVPESRRVLFPNWVGDAPAEPVPAGETAAIRAEHGIPADVFLAFYSGNIGRKQGIEILVEAASLLREAGGPRPVWLVIAGDGAGRADLEARFAAAGDVRVRLLPLLPGPGYRAMLAAADVCVITQAAGTGRFFFPSKLLSILSARRPVVAVADDDSELAIAVKDGGFGVLVPPGRPDLLAGRLTALAADPAPLAELARRADWVDRFRRTRVLDAFEQVLLRAAGRAGDATGVAGP